MSESRIQVSRRSLCHRSLSMHPKTQSGGSSPRSSELLFTTDLAKVFAHKTSLHLRSPQEPGSRITEEKACRPAGAPSLAQQVGGEGSSQNPRNWPVGDIRGSGGQGEEEGAEAQQELRGTLEASGADV